MAPLQPRPWLLIGGALLALGGALVLRVLSPSAVVSAALEPGAGAAVATDEVPLVWPLGSDGYEPCELYDSHGQYMYIADWYVTPSTHRGIDIGACPGDPVYAVAAGTVVEVQGEGGQYATVFVSDGDSADVAWKYQHLDEIVVDPEQPVQRDELLGYIVKYDDFCGFDHLHLQRVTYSWDTDSDGKEILWEQDAGNPLPLLPARADASAPVASSTDAAGAPTDPLQLYDADWNELERDPATGELELEGKIQVVARASELFPGRGPAFCSSWECCEAGFAKLLAPYRLSLSVLVPVDPDADTALARTTFKPVYHNTIELSGPNSDAEKLADELYHPDSAADYTERELLFVLTHGSDLELDATGVDSYRFELLVEDTSGNVAVQRMLVKVAD
jgi:hypothetical protein